MSITTCSRCGQVIAGVVIINGLPYGTTCAEIKLGIKQFPSWFKGGDWDKAKAEYEKKKAIDGVEHQRMKEITSEYWGDWILVSKIIWKGQRLDNQWLIDFGYSLLTQLGYPYFNDRINFATYEDFCASNEFDYGAWSLLKHIPKKRVSELSEKQKDIIRKNVD
jgi:hypothetical protein